MNTRHTFPPSPRPARGEDERLISPPLPSAVAPTRTVTSDSLFRGSHEIGIEHEGALYRLKITRQGKLILNK